MKEECHYVIEPELTYTYFADAARNNSFNREQLQKAFNNIEQSDPIFADLFADIDLYSNRLGTGDQKQSDTVASLIKEIDKADLLNSDAEILGNAYEYLIGQLHQRQERKPVNSIRLRQYPKFLPALQSQDRKTNRIICL